MREPLGRFVVECCVHEPSELNVAPLRRGLVGQFPGDGIEFSPEDKGEELERAAFWLKVVFDVLGHKAVPPDRGRSLANELATVFGFALDPRVPPEELRTQTEKLLAERCYHNTLPTAVKSIDQALTIRAALLARFPQQLAPDLRDQIDVDLLAVGLSRGNDQWPKLEAIFKTCLASTNVNVGLKLIDLYAKANAELAPKMETLLAGKWKAAGSARLTHAAKVAAIRKGLVSDPNTVRMARAERLAQLQKLAGGTLAAVQPGQQPETTLLQDCVRLAHASTMGAILFSKDAEPERFDALIGKIPAIRPDKMDQEAKNPEEKPRQPVAKGVITLEAGFWNTQDRLTVKCERDPRRGAFRKTYAVALQAGQFYSIDMRSAALNCYLRLESAAGVQVAVGNGFPNASILHVPQADGVYRLVASSTAKDAVGAFTLQIQLGGGFGGFGIPRPIFGPKGPFVPGAP